MLLLVTWGTRVHVTVGGGRYAMPLALSFLLIWQYPSQESVSTLVHPAEVGSWSLLVVVSIVLVAGQADASDGGRTAYQPKQNSAASTR